MPFDSRGRAARRLAAALALTLAALTGACGGSSATTPTATPVTSTETFSGALAAGGASFHNITVAQAGTLTMTLTAFAPQSTITVGLGIGTASGTSCTVSSTSETTKLGTVLNGTIAAGAYCVQIYDIGNVVGSDDYTITVNHP
jgi:hypothetical protein